SSAVYQWDVSGAVPKKHDPHPGPCSYLWKVMWSQDGSQIVAQGTGKHAWLWDWDGKRFQGALAWPVSAPHVEAMALAPDGRTLATGSRRLLQFWDMSSRPPKPIAKDERGT